MLLRRCAFVLALNLIGGVVASSSVLADEEKSRSQAYAIASLANVAGATSSDAIDIGDHGQVVGMSGDHAVMQERGRLTDLGVPAGRAYSWAFGQNERGQIVGGASDASGVAHAAVLIGVRMAPGQMLFTRMPRGATSCARLFMSSMTPPFEAA